MAGKIRLGIVGATVTPGGSGWGANAHVPALRALPDYELKAACTAHAETARASAEAFGAELAFHDFDAMVASPEVDMVSVVVRVPGHKALVDKALQAGKAVYCEWPLGRTLAEAEAMAELARSRGLRSAVGLQARSDPAVTHARDLVRDGYVGEVLAVRLSSISQTISERGNGRIWQGDRRNGANTLTIQAGHAIDALCFVVGELEEVSARLATRTTEWRNTETGETMKVDSPDWISVSGRFEGGAEASFLTATVPFNPSGNRFEIYGREGTLVLSGGALNTGPTQLAGARGKDALAPIEPPAGLRAVGEGLPEGPPRNVGQAYARFAAALAAGELFHPDFDHAVRRHTLIEAIERSAAERRAVRVQDVRPVAANR